MDIKNTNVVRSTTLNIHQPRELNAQEIIEDHVNNTTVVVLVLKSQEKSAENDDKQLRV